MRLPCHTCGSREVRVEYRAYFRGRKRILAYAWFVECAGCAFPLSGPHHDKDAALEIMRRNYGAKEQEDHDE